MIAALVLAVVVMLVVRLVLTKMRRGKAAYRADVSALAPTQEWQARHAPKDGGIFFRHEGF
jgi:hypothetical protein